MKPKYLRVLSLLEQGVTVQLDGHILVIGEREGISVVAINGTSTTNGSTKTVLVRADEVSSG